MAGKIVKMSLREGVSGAGVGDGDEPEENDAVWFE